MADQLIHFGKLSLVYENGFVRYIRAGEIEIVRMIYFALRDSNWITAEFVRSDERMSVTHKGFDVSYTATNIVDSKAVFRWHVKISGNDSGEIEFSVDGEALASYTRNRAGICVLHPIRDTRDKVVKIVRPDGSVYESKFPSVIEPHQPFFDITKMTWQLRGDSWAEIQFEGDVFETEDQRNWSDTSFKTYSTPLAIPYPVTLKPGDRVSQKVRLKVINPEGLPSSDFSEDIEVVIDESSSKPFPKIGVDFPGYTDLTREEIDLLKALTFDHLRIEVVLSSPGWKEQLKAGLEEAKLISADPFVHLILSDNVESEWKEFVGALSTGDAGSIKKLALSPLDRKANVDDLLLAVSMSAQSLFPKATFGAGFTSYFTELNRNRFDYSKVDFVIYSLNPQVHATDSHTIIENLPAQKDAVESAHLLATGKKVDVGPVSIKPRFNPDAKSGTKENSTYRFDARQSTTMVAGWALASIKYLSEGGADSITLFESHGMAGYFLNHQRIFPVYNALLSLVKLNPVRVITSVCNEPLVVSSLVIETENSKRHLFLINHTDSKKTVSVGDDLHTLADHELKIIPQVKVIPLYK